METIVFILLGFILGICIGNTSIRNKIGEELKTIITRKGVKDCPMKENYRASYIPKKETKSEAKSEPKQSNTLCSECGNPIEIIDKMPGFFFCDNCKKVVTLKKEGVK